MTTRVPDHHMSHDTGWTCPICGESYPSTLNAGVPNDGIIILIHEQDLDQLKPHLPKTAITHHVKDGLDEEDTTA